MNYHSGRILKLILNLKDLLLAFRDLLEGSIYTASFQVGSQQSGGI